MLRDVLLLRDILITMYVLMFGPSQITATLVLDNPVGTVGQVSSLSHLSPSHLSYDTQALSFTVSLGVSLVLIGECVVSSGGGASSVSVVCAGAVPVVLVGGPVEVLPVPAVLVLG